MDILYKILICFFAGAGAGLGNGFVGMTTAAVIGPIIMTFLNVTPYQAVGIGFASDVCASAISAYTYYKNKNLDIKNSIPLLITIIVTTAIGSYISSLFPARTMGNVMHFVMIALGITFFFRKPVAIKENAKVLSPGKKLMKIILCGSFIGFTCGFVGAGGGIMIFMVLTSVLGYKMHMAIGTSVFIMAFTALTGFVSHVRLSGVPDITTLIFCAIFTLISAKIAATIANKTNERTLNRVVGVALFVIGIAIWIVSIQTKS